MASNNSGGSVIAMMFIILLGYFYFKSKSTGVPLLSSTPSGTPIGYVMAPDGSAIFVGTPSAGVSAGLTPFAQQIDNLGAIDAAGLMTPAAATPGNPFTADILAFDASL